MGVVLFKTVKVIKNRKSLRNSWPRGAYRDTMTVCYVVSWVGSWNR